MVEAARGEMRDREKSRKEEWAVLEEQEWGEQLGDGAGWSEVGFVVRFPRSLLSPLSNLWDLGDLA